MADADLAAALYERLKVLRLPGEAEVALGWAGGR